MEFSALPHFRLEKIEITFYLFFFLLYRRLRSKVMHFQISTEEFWFSWIIDWPITLLDFITLDWELRTMIKSTFSSLNTSFQKILYPKAFKNSTDNCFRFGNSGFKFSMKKVLFSKFPDFKKNFLKKNFVNSNKLNSIDAFEKHVLSTPYTKEPNWRTIKLTFKNNFSGLFLLSTNLRR